MHLSMLNKKLVLTPELHALALRVGLGLLLLAVAAYVMVVMSLQEQKRLTAEIAEVRAGIRRQQVLAPAWVGMAALSHNASLDALSLPEPEPVPRTRVYLMPEQLEHMARAVGVEPLEVTLNPASMAQDPTTIQATGMFSGPLEGVRELLMGVSRLPSLSRLERVELRAVDGRLELFLQLRIALAN